MAEFLEDPSGLTKDKLKSALLANNVALPNGDQRKGVYVDLYLKNLTSQNKKSVSVETFSSDEELAAPTITTSSSKTRSARKVTRKTDRHEHKETDVTELTDEGLRDQLLKCGVNPGPIMASTRKLYEKKLQRLLDQGPPETVVLVTETVETRSADSDQYSDKDEDTAVVPEPEFEPEPEPEPVPVVERPLRSRGKTPVTTRTRSTQHVGDVDEQEEDFRALDVQRKSRRSSRRLDQPFPATDEPDFSKLSASEMLPPPKQRKQHLAIPKDPKPRLADEVPVSSITKSSSSKSTKYQIATIHPSLEFHEALSVDKSFKSKTSSKLTKQFVLPCSTSPQLSKDLIHMMCRLSPPPASPDKESSHSTFLGDSPYCPMQDLPVTKSLSKECSGSLAALSSGKQTKIQRFLSPAVHVLGQDDAFIEERRIGPIEKLTAVEQTPKTPQKDVLKDFLKEIPSTPTGISATCRPPIKGAAGRPFSDEWLDNLRLRHTEVKHTSSSYTESKSVPRVNAVPLVASKPAAPLNVQAKTRRRLPVWAQLLLLSAVAGFLFFVYQAMESNELSPFAGSEGDGK